MVIVCPGCKNQITFDDATIPGGVFKVRCTGCGRSINTQKKVERSQPHQSASTPPVKPVATITDQSKAQNIPSDVSRISPELQNFVNSQITTAKQEILQAIQTLFRGSSASLPAPGLESLISSNMALVCSGDPATLDVLVGLLKPMGYQIQSSTTASESLKAVDISYDLIVIDPSFTDDLEGAKKLIGRINSKKATERRKVFTVLLSSTQKSLDGNSAFLGGVNLIVNKADLNSLESFIRQGQNYFQKLYATLENTG